MTINMKINRIKSAINNFSCYTPQYKVKGELGDIRSKISIDLKQKLDAYVIEFDNKFSL